VRLLDGDHVLETGVRRELRQQLLVVRTALARLVVGDLDVGVTVLVGGEQVLVAELGERADTQLDLPRFRPSVGVTAGGQTHHSGKGDRAG
jgi:hypothetical protein